jgi:hypothetical protein
METKHVLPFGRYKGRTVDRIDTGYLRWLLTIRLSSGLRSAVVETLRSRGVTVPEPPPPPTPPPSCRGCKGATVIDYSWYEDRLGRRFIKRRCRRCGADLGFAPHVQPYVGLADASASPTALLDVLVAAEDLGVELRSDGAAAGVAGGWRNVTPELRRRLGECRSQLGRLLGDRRGGER